MILTKEYMLEQLKSLENIDFDNLPPVKSYLKSLDDLIKLAESGVEITFNGEPHNNAEATLKAVRERLIKENQ